jgi:hypothetical protein
MGHAHFLTKGLENVSTEMSVCVLAYSLKDDFDARREATHCNEPSVTQTNDGGSRVTSSFSHGQSHWRTSRAKTGVVIRSHSVHWDLALPRV